MGKKRKAAEGETNGGEKTVVPAEEDGEPPVKRTLTGPKDPEELDAAKRQTGFRNKEKTLVVCSRRITFRYRHLMMDLLGLLPHSKKDVKLQVSDTKHGTLVELADLRGCTSCIYLECRKRQDLYMWISKFPNGPSAKFLVKSVHTMAELKLTGNHLKGSRPILTFSSDFDTQPYLELLKQLFIQIFGTPKDHRKSKPFFDHVLTFSILDNHIWFRNYQISVPHQGTKKLEHGALDKMTLIEVGPRFCMNPIKVLGGSMGGKILYENPLYTSPNLIRSVIQRKTSSYKRKIKAKKARKAHMQANTLEPDEFTELWRE